jgi:hypothetical protein
LSPSYSAELGKGKAQNYFYLATEKTDANPSAHKPATALEKDPVLTPSQLCHVPPI